MILGFIGKHTRNHLNTRKLHGCHGGREQRSILPAFEVEDKPTDIFNKWADAIESHRSGPWLVLIRPLRSFALQIVEQALLHPRQRLAIDSLSGDICRRSQGRHTPSDCFRQRHAIHISSAAEASCLRSPAASLSRRWYPVSRMSISACSRCSSDR